MSAAGIHLFIRRICHQDEITGIGYEKERHYLSPVNYLCKSAYFGSFIIESAFEHKTVWRTHATSSSAEAMLKPLYPPVVKVVALSGLHKSSTGDDLWNMWARGNVSPLTLGGHTARNSWSSLNTWYCGPHPVATPFLQNLSQHCTQGYEFTVLNDVRQSRCSAISHPTFGIPLHIFTLKHRTPHKKRTQGQFFYYLTATVH